MTRMWNVERARCSLVESERTLFALVLIGYDSGMGAFGEHEWRRECSSRSSNDCSIGLRRTPLRQDLNRLEYPFASIALSADRNPVDAVAPDPTQVRRGCTALHGRHRLLLG